MKIAPQTSHLFWVTENLQALCHGILKSGFNDARLVDPIEGLLDLGNETIKH
jgi:hypothetical protein